MKDQFQANETVEIRFLPFIDRTNGTYILGTDSAQVTISKPGTPRVVTTEALVWDTDVQLWMLDVAPPHSAGEWRMKALSSDLNAQPQWKSVMVGDYVDDITDAKYAAQEADTKIGPSPVSLTSTLAEIKAKTDLIPEAHYRMRGFDTILSQTVYWDAPAVDPSGTYYGGLGPLTGVVLVDRF